jgi:hypothetical protein
VLAACFAVVVLYARRELNGIHRELRCEQKLISDLWDKVYPQDEGQEAKEGEAT